MQGKARFFKDIADAAAVARKEAGTDTIGNGPQPEIEAGWLDLVLIKRLFRGYRPCLKQRFQIPIGQDALSCLNHALIPFRQEA